MIFPNCKPVPRGNKAGEAINYTGKKEKEVKLTGQEAELCRLNWPYFIARALFSQGSSEPARKGESAFHC